MDNGRRGERAVPPGHAQPRVSGTTPPSGPAAADPADRLRVAGGAVVAGARGDAWLRVAGPEHARRGGRSCTDLALLDVLGRLPLHRPVPTARLTDRERAVLLTAPAWTVESGPAHIERVARPPVTVGLVTCEGGAWRVLLRRAAAFRYFAPAAVLLPRLPARRPETAWEADVAGVGVYVRDGDAIREVLAPVTPGYPRKAAHWRFEERAYRAWALTA